MLPRVTDAVQSGLKLLSNATTGERVTLFIADVTDAFWLVPLNHSERKYFVAKLQGKFYVFLSTAQGSRGAPLTFAVLMSLISRFVQSVLAGPCRSGQGPEGILQVYVDDPLALLLGTEKRTNRLACMVMVSWLLMGLPLAFHKAVLSNLVTWIGVDLGVKANSIWVEVPQTKVAELITIVSEILKKNVLPV